MKIYEILLMKGETTSSMGICML